MRPRSIGGHSRTLAQAGIAACSVGVGHRPPPVLVNTTQPQMKPNITIKVFNSVDVSRDVFNYLGRKPDRMIADVMRQPLRPEIHTVRQLGASIRHPAKTTGRDACLEPRLVSPLEVRGDDLAFALIPGLINEVVRIRPVALVLATPIPDEADAHSLEYREHPNRSHHQVTFPSSGAGEQLTGWSCSVAADVG